MSTAGKKKKPLYYAVSNGRRIGIYSNWEKAEEQVIRFPGNVFKSYSTLDEARAAMRIKGYDDPPLFISGNVTNQSISDTNLTMDVLAVKELPDTITTRPVLILDHPKLDNEEMIVCSQKRSVSDSDLLNAVTTMNLTNDDDEIDDETIVKSFAVNKISSNSTDHVFQDPNLEANSVQHITKDSIKSKSDEQPTDLYYDLMSQMNAKIDQLEAKLNDQYNINHEIISSLAKLQNDQSLFQKDHLKQMEDIKLCIEKLQKKSSNENMKESLSEAIKNTEIIESHFCKLSNDLNTQIQSNNEIIVSVHTKLDEMKTQNVQSKMCELSTNFDNHLKNSEQTMTSVYRKLDELNIAVTQLQTTNMSSAKTSKVIQTDHDSILPDTTITQNMLFKHSSTNSSSQCSEHVSNENNNEDIEMLRYHPTLGDMNNRKNIGLENQNNAVKQSLRISKGCKNALFGDSNLKMVNRSRLDNTKSTEIRTYRGASIKKLHEYISSSQETFPDVQKVSLSVGSVDCSRRYIDEESIINDYNSLLTSVQKTFPSADIGIVSIPPHGNPQTTRFISKINNDLKTLARHRNVTFCFCEALWMHTNDNGSVDDGILTRDRIHLTLRGVGLMLRSITRFFFGYQKRQQQRDARYNLSYATEDEGHSDQDSLIQFMSDAQAGKVIPQRQSPQHSSIQSSQEKDNHQHQSPMSDLHNTPTNDYLQHITMFTDNIAKALTDGLVNFTKLVVPSPNIPSHALYSTVAKSSK